MLTARLRLGAGEGWVRLRTFTFKFNLPPWCWEGTPGVFHLQAQDKSTHARVRHSRCLSWRGCAVWPWAACLQLCGARDGPGPRPGL